MYTEYAAIIQQILINATESYPDRQRHDRPTWHGWTQTQIQTHRNDGQNKINLF